MNNTKEIIWLWLPLLGIYSMGHAQQSTSRPISHEDLIVSFRGEAEVAAHWFEKFIGAMNVN